MKSLFGGAYAGRRVMVTGHTGFKGSWLCLWLRALGAEVVGLSLPPPTKPAHWDLLALEDVQDRRADLRDMDAVMAALAASQPEVVFHLGAQSLVRRGYRDPLTTFSSNVNGLLNLFEAIRPAACVKALLNVTTDKVYREPPCGNLGYVEEDPLGGHDPYSTSKACAELLTDSYRQSYFAERNIPVATARAGNVIGGGDWAEDRLVPDFVRAVTTGTPLQLRNPGAVRPWQHVLEPLAGYLSLGAALLRGENFAESAWNFGPRPEDALTVETLAKCMQASWPEARIALSQDDHPRESPLLRLNSTKAQTKLGWRPVWSAQTAVARTLAWYRAFYRSSRLCSREDLEIYVNDARSAGLRWAS